MTATTIQELFEKPVDRPIDGVIKADDERHLQIELDEYVVTREVAKGLNVFTEAYLHNPTANGVWISGFFGSGGKSHLLKMLSLMLDSKKQVENQRPAEILLPKVDDEILRADLKKATAIPSRSLLFNIDQKYDGIGGTHEAPVLEVFMKVLNELQGYYGNQGYVAQLEHDMASRGEFEPFQQTYVLFNNRLWSDDRDAVATVLSASSRRLTPNTSAAATTTRSSDQRRQRELPPFNRRFAGECGSISISGTRLSAQFFCLMRPATSVRNAAASSICKPW